MKRLVWLCGSIVALMIILPAMVLFASTNIRALASNAVSMFTGSRVEADGYDYGYCTYWVALRRIQIGEPIPNSWGNAITWAIRAERDGYLVDHTPAFGSIMQDPNAPGGEGHVAFVEHVNQITGYWTISEMNRVGWDEIDTRTLSPASALAYNFIH